MPSVEPRSPTAAGASTSSRRAPTPAGRAAGRYSTSSSSSQGGPGKRREARIFKPRLFLSALRGGGSSVGRAPGCGPGGRGFESPPPPHRRKSGRFRGHDDFRRFSLSLQSLGSRARAGRARRPTATIRLDVYGSPDLGRNRPMTPYEKRPRQVGGHYRTESINLSAGLQISAFAAGLVAITERWSALNDPFDLTKITLICEPGKPAGSSRRRITLAPTPPTLVSLSPSMMSSFSLASSFSSGPSRSYGETRPGNTASTAARS